MFGLKITLLLATLLLLSGCGDKELTFKNGRYPTGGCRRELSNGTHFRASHQIDKIVVKKREHRMYLYRRGKEVYRFRISLGENPQGDKVKRGDHKTPLGSYTITQKGVIQNTIE